MKDTFCKRKYKCKCGITTDYVWESKLPKHEVKCYQCAKLLGFKDLNKKKYHKLHPLEHQQRIDNVNQRNQTKPKQSENH